jgi:hypothetical protein
MTLASSRPPRRSEGAQWVERPCNHPIGAKYIHKFSHRFGVALLNNEEITMPIFKFGTAFLEMLKG